MAKAKTAPKKAAAAKKPAAKAKKAAKKYAPLDLVAGEVFHFLATLRDGTR